MEITWPAAATLMSIVAGISIPLTAFIIRGILVSQMTNVYVKAVDFVRLEGETVGLTRQMTELKSWLGDKFKELRDDKNPNRRPGNGIDHR